MVDHDYGDLRDYMRVDFVPALLTNTQSRCRPITSFLIHRVVSSSIDPPTYYGSAQNCEGIGSLKPSIIDAIFKH